MAEIFKIIPAKEFRNTKDVQFNLIPILEDVISIDRVKHGVNAISPGAVEGVEKPWYMHPNQIDNLIVFHGTRYVELYSVEHGKVEYLEVTPEQVIKDGNVLHEGPAIVTWPTNVFHRIRSGEEGSMSVNFAQRTDGFDIKTNFNIYDLNITTGEFQVIRAGHLDQK